MQCSSSTFDILRQAGWFPERRIDPTSYRRYLTDRGILYNDKVEEFIVRFGGLQIAYKTIFKMPDTIDLDILRQVRVDKSVVEDDISLLGTPVSFLGSYGGGMIVVTMDVYGNIYSSGDSNLYEFGQDSLQAIERMIYHKPLRIIERPPDE